MKFASIGTRAVLLFSPRSENNRDTGFTLLEALAALTLVLAFAAALTPLLFHSRRIMLNADGRVGAQILARALLQEPLDRAALASLAREGTTEGLDWQLRSEPTDIKVALPYHAPKQTPPQPGANSAAATSVSPAAPANQWAAYRVIASVSWAPGQSVNVETVRLGKAE